MEELERPLLGEDEQIDSEAEELLALYDTHCATEGCPNGEFTIRVPAGVNNPVVICGGCGQLITDCVAIE